MLAAKVGTSAVSLEIRVDRGDGRLRITAPSGNPALLLADCAPWARPRRRDGHLTLSTGEVLRLQTEGVPIELDDDTARWLVNRSRVHADAAGILDESRRILEAGGAAARERIRDCSIADKLDDHQAVNVAAMVVPGGWGACVFDEQGTGKTISVVGAFDTLVSRQEAETLLVVAPKSMIGEWAVEFRRFAGGLYEVAVADGTRTDGHGPSTVEPMSWSSTTKRSARSPTYSNCWRSGARTVMVIDESFFVKNPDSRRAQSVRELREWCTRCFVLCGTPAPNAAHDLVAQVDLVDFGRTFGGVKIDKDRQVAQGQVRSILDDRGFYLRNLKSDVLPNLPKRRFVEVPVEMSAVQRRRLRPPARRPRARTTEHHRRSILAASGPLPRTPRTASAHLLRPGTCSRWLRRDAGEDRRTGFAPCRLHRVSSREGRCVVVLPLVSSIG